MNPFKFIKGGKFINEGVKQYLETVFFVAFVVLWFALLFIISPEELVHAIGIDGGYLLIFFTAIIGASALSSVPFYTLIFSFAATGEFNPIILGLVAAPALVFGDYLFYYLGLKSRLLFGKNLAHSLSDWIDRRPRWAVPFVAFAYTVFIPLPQDILMLALGLVGVGFGRVVIPLILGNAIFIGLVSYFISAGIGQ